MMEQLPTEVMTHFMEFMDIPTRVKLAGCNTTLQRRVFRECSQAWLEIDFASLDRAFRERLTDLDLSRLLTRVNAREVTTFLYLCGCAKIEGQGLTPLQFSRVLRGVNLLGTGADEHPTPFLWTLRTMLPFNLFDVPILGVTRDDPLECALDFERNLREVRATQAKEQRSLCESCQEPVLERSRSLVPGFFGIPMMQCCECEKFFCRRVSCPMDFRDCHNCGKAFCKECDIVGQCRTCGLSYCSNCHSMDECNDCGRSCCEDCEGIRKCDNCQEFVCEDCGKSPDVCTNGCFLCSDCKIPESCNACKGQFCKKCTSGSKKCSRCSESYCGKTLCLENVGKCTACDALFCKHCKELEHCSLCEKRFCKGHKRFVDCTECETRHCRACGNKNQCKWCATACFEECLCDEQRPAKRTKLA